jgi:hypothetical protein
LKENNFNRYQALLASKAPRVSEVEISFVIHGFLEKLGRKNGCRSRDIGRNPPQPSSMSRAASDLHLYADFPQVSQKKKV